MRFSDRRRLKTPPHPFSPASRLIAATALWPLSAAAAAANPFLESVGGTAAPITRAPTSSGPAALVALQIAFRDKAAEFLSAFKDDPRPSTVAAVLLVAFLYGLFHAAGPGHRKTVVFSLFISRKAASWEPLAAGFLSALVHAASGMAVVFALGLIKGMVAPLADTQSAGAYLEAGTFLALIVLAAALAIGKAAAMIRNGKGYSHDHGDGKGKLGLYGMVFVTSVVPCPGAVVILLFALYLDLALIGIAGALAMSLGMGIVISVAGYLAYFGRVGLFARLKGKERLVGIVSDFMELGSYLIVAAFSLFMAWPFLVSAF